MRGRPFSKCSRRDPSGPSDESGGRQTLQGNFPHPQMLLAESVWSALPCACVTSGSQCVAWGTMLSPLGYLQMASLMCPRVQRCDLRRVTQQPAVVRFSILNPVTQYPRSKETLLCTPDMQSSMKSVRVAPGAWAAWNSACHSHIPSKSFLFLSSSFLLFLSFLFFPIGLHA